MATLNSNPIVYHARDTSTAALSKRKHLMHLQQEEQREDEQQDEPWTAEEVFGQCSAHRPAPPTPSAGILKDRVTHFAPLPSTRCCSCPPSPSSVRLPDLIRHINDPEHPLTLEQLNVAQLALVRVTDLGHEPAVPGSSSIDIQFTPTIPHCRSDRSPRRHDEGSREARSQAPTNHLTREQLRQREGARRAILSQALFC